MAQGPFQRAIQRIANSLGVLMPAQRAIRVASPLTVADVPDQTLRGASGDGETTGYTQIGLDTSLLPGVVTSRIVAGTSPIRINGGASADLGTTNITVSIEPATTLAPGSMSAADKTLLANATVAPTPGAILLRGPSGEGKCTNFEASSGGEYRFNIAGTEVTGMTCDGLMNMQIGDAVDTESIVMIAGVNKNISDLVNGTGTRLMAAVGALSTITVSSNAVNVIQAIGGNLSLSGIAGTWATTAALSATAGTSLTLAGGSSGAGDIILSVTGSERARIKSTGIQFPNTQDATIDVVSVAAGDGKNLLLSAGNVTAGGGNGGSFALTCGTNPGGPTGNVVCVMPFGSGGISGMFKLTDGTDVFIDAYATAALTSIIGDRATTLDITTGALTMSAADNVILDCGAGDLILLKVGGTEVARFDAGGPPAPQSVGAANSAGASTELALADHVHAVAWQKELGANTLTGTTTTRYLGIGHEAGTASANPLDMPVTKAFQIDSMHMKARIGGTAGATITATIRKNGASVGTAALATASDATSGSSTFTAVSFAPGDSWGFQVDKSAAIASSPTDIIWAVGCTPP